MNTIDQLSTDLDLARFADDGGNLRGRRRLATIDKGGNREPLGQRPRCSFGSPAGRGDWPGNYSRE